MPRTLGAIAAALVFAPAFGLADALQSPACLSALEALTQAEDEAHGTPGVPAAPEGGANAPRPAAALVAARRNVAQACLGTEDTTPPRERYSPPVAVERLQQPGPPSPPPGPVQRPPVQPVSPAPRPDPLHMTTLCDATGCWTNDGIRLQRQGPVLMGPRGPCLQIGAVLNCP
jgi:hypothetical protein